LWPSNTTRIEEVCRLSEPSSDSPGAENAVAELDSRQSTQPIIVTVCDHTHLAISAIVIIAHFRFK
jgi:hypothetical protein